MVADVLHAGHIIAIEEAKSHCDYLIVGLNCAPSYKTPVQSIYERFIQLRGVKWIDEIIPYDDSCKELLMSSLQYDIYFLGEDYIDKSFQGKEILQERNKEIYYLSRQHNLSSTNVKNAIVENAQKKI